MLTFEFPSPLSAASFFEQVHGSAARTHRVVEVYDHDGNAAQGMRDLAAVFAGREVPSRRTP